MKPGAQTSGFMFFGTHLIHLFKFYVFSKIHIIFCFVHHRNGPEWQLRANVGK